MKQHHIHFLKEFFRHPVQTGALAPSSQHLADRIANSLDLSTAKVVIEYGSGTGALTSSILSRLSPDCRFIAVEQNPVLVAMLRSRFPKIEVIEDSVENIQAICRSAGITSVDCIVSGLPWAAFPEHFQTNLLEATMSVLRPGGQFATFAYLIGLPLPRGQMFKKNLLSYFSEVRVSRPIWLNFPPAIIYSCRR